MPYEIIMPKLGLTMKTGTIVNWLKNEGSRVNNMEPLLEIETEKLSYTIESPASGVLLKIIGAIGEKYPVKTILGFVGQSGEVLPTIPASNADSTGIMHAVDSSDAAKTSSIPALSSIDAPPAVKFDKLHFNTASTDTTDIDTIDADANRRVFISPIAKKMALENGIDYKKISGTGPNGRIVKADVQKYMGNIADEATMTFTGNDGDINDELELFGVDAIPEIIIPYKGIRRNVGETMKKAWMTIPMVTHQVSADAGALVDYRTLLNKNIHDSSDRVTVGELMLKLTAAALVATPSLNSSLTDAGIVIHSGIHIGMATALVDGLIVPVIRDIDKKGLLPISREAKSLVNRAKSGSLSPDDVYGATFTVSNLGGFGSVDYFTPIINPPQAAILGVGRVVDTVVPIDGEVKIRPMVGLSLTYDHRIVDGATAAAFIKTLMTLMENPARAVLL